MKGGPADTSGSTKKHKNAGYVENAYPRERNNKGEAFKINSHRSKK